MRKSLVSSLPLAILLLLLSTLPASAGTENCPGGALCVYWDSSFRGTQYKFFGSNDSWHSWAIADDDSSWYNAGLSGMDVVVMEHVNGGGEPNCIRWTAAIALGLGLNDQGSSNYWNWGCGPP